MRLSFSTTALYMTVASSSHLLLPRQITLNPPIPSCALDFQTYTLDAQCITATQEYVKSKLALDKCLTNSFGQLKFLSLGGFSATCDDCTFNSSTLDYTCACDNGSNVLVFSTINLKAITPEAAGIFLQDDGNIACRAPEHL